MSDLRPESAFSGCTSTHDTPDDHAAAAVPALFVPAVAAPTAAQGQSAPAPMFMAPNTNIAGALPLATGGTAAAVTTTNVLNANAVAHLGQPVAGETPTEPANMDTDAAMTNAGSNRTTYVISPKSPKNQGSYIKGSDSMLRLSLLTLCVR